MKTTFIRTCTIAAVLGLFAACSDNTQLGTKGDIAAPQKPSFLLSDPLNTPDGACLAQDAFASGATQGVNGPTDLADPNQHCTANDISIAQADVLQYSLDGTTFFPFTGAPIACDENTPIFVDLNAHVKETATSERTDIGVWIATDGGNARTGTCNQYNLIAPPNGTNAAGVYNIDNDHCGDMNNASEAIVHLGVIPTTCQTATATSNLLHVGSCLGWTQPGGDQVCPQGGSETANGYRFGTVPGTTSKCNCGGFDVPITVRKTAKLEVRKVCDPTTDGGTFDLLIDGSTTVNAVVVGDNKACGTGTGAQTVSAGTNTAPGAVHSFGEGDFTTANYTSSYACVNRVGTPPQHAFTASGDAAATGTSLGPNQITLLPNEDVVCTFTNVRKPSLTLVKTISNDNGGTKTLSDFPLTAAGPVTISGVSGTTAVSGRIVTAGAYALSEQTQANYTAGSWVCTGGGTQSGANITLGAGSAATCTINNNDVGPTLTLVKVVTNDNGGTKTLSDFPLTASGPVTISGVSGGTAVTARVVNAGSYALTEQTQTGYSASSWSCTGGTQTGANIALALGGAATCTISNNDVAPTLTLVKTLTNDNGGTKTLSDFPLTASGPVTISGVSATTAVTGRAVNAGSYALTEQTQTGYTASAWVCTGGTQTGSNIALAIGGSATCTINNDDTGALLTLVKVVTNDNGGTLTLSDFPLTASGPQTISGVSGATAITGRSVNAGSYALTEQTQTGYTASSWSCSGGTQTGANIALALGGAATCTITNNDVGPTLTLVKTVTNNDGGTKTLSDFPLTASGPVTISGVSGGTAVSARIVNAGSYALTEQTQTGYTASSWSCSGGTQTGANIALALAGSATCTINNNDNPPSLTLVKIVTNDNGGTKTLSDFPLTASGPVTISGVSGGTAVTARPVSGGSYALTEQTQTGYTASSWSCSGGTQTGANIALASGGSATCTITNNDIGPTLTLVKIVTNDNGGTKTLSDFPLTASGPVTISGVSGGTAVSGRIVNAGSYALTEQTQTGYTASSWSCSGGTQTGANIALALAGSATCTISNNDNAPTLTIRKTVIGDGATFPFATTGAGLDPTFNLTPLSNASADKVYSAGLTIGTKTVVEGAHPGYLLTDFACSRGGVNFVVGDPAAPTVPLSVTLTLGDNVLCTFVNQQQVSQTTRTQGFWATHSSITEAVWFGGTVGGNTFPGVTDKTLCGESISTLPILLGGFWSNISQTTTKVKRTDLDQAKMRLLQQLLAAILNHAAFGSSPSGSISIDQAKTAFCTGTLAEVNAAAAAMGAFNESGDSGVFTPGASANGKLAKDLADLLFWDTLPGSP